MDAAAALSQLLKATPFSVAFLRARLASGRQPHAGFALAFRSVTAARGPFFWRHRGCLPSNRRRKSMATIANLNVKPDGSLAGTLAPLTVPAQIPIFPKARTAKDTQPVHHTHPRPHT